MDEQQQIDTNTKLVIIRYDSLDDLLYREEAMIRTLLNNLERENKYEYIGSFISIRGDKFLLNLEIKPLV